MSQQDDIRRQSDNAMTDPVANLVERLERQASGMTGLGVSHPHIVTPELISLLREAASRLASQESPVLAFQTWVERTVADRGRKLTQDEYFIAQAAFFAAHPGEGPQSSTASRLAEGTRVIGVDWATDSDWSAEVTPPASPAATSASWLIGHVYQAPETSAASRPAQTCEWKEDDEGVWHTGCGNAWEFTDGGPYDNRQKFCGYCGGFLVNLPAPPAPGAQDKGK